MPLDIDIDHITATATSLAAVAAAVAAWQAGRATRETVELVGIERERRSDEERHQRSADLTVGVVVEEPFGDEHRHISRRVVVTNLGPCSARDVNLADSADDENKTRRLLFDAFPVQVLGPGSSASALSVMTWGDDPTSPDPGRPLGSTAGRATTARAPGSDSEPSRWATSPLRRTWR